MIPQKLGGKKLAKIYSRMKVSAVMEKANSVVRLISASISHVNTPMVGCQGQMK